MNKIHNVELQFAFEVFKEGMEELLFFLVDNL